MKYNIQKMEGDADSVRYALVQKGEKTLFVVGLNPSTANEDTPDRTMNRVMEFAEHNKYDGFVMLNLYPQRSTEPTGLHMDVNKEYFQKNLKIIEEYISQEKSPTVLFCYGNNISLRPYLRESAEKIKQICERYTSRIVCVAKTKYSIPKHPLYVKIGDFIDY